MHWFLFACRKIENELADGRSIVISAVSTLHLNLDVTSELKNRVFSAI